MLVFIIFCVVPVVSAYPQGAPSDACMSMFPKHFGTQSQLDRSVYRVISNDTHYTPGIPVSVIVDSPIGIPFKGVQIRARRTEINKEEIIGEFTSLWPLNKLTYVICQGKKRSMVTHNNTDMVLSVRLDWIPPDRNVGPIVFDVTVVQSFHMIYFGLTSSIVKASTSAEPDLPSTIIGPVSSSMSSINWDECGNSKGCLFYPRYCTGSNCKVAVSYQVNDTDNTINFEIMASATDYVSLGISRDRIMGDDQTMSCTTLFDKVTIQHGFNHERRYNFRLPSTNFTNLQASKVDDVIQCRFTRPVFMKLDVLLEEFGDFPTTPFTFDLNEEFYVFLAWGITYTLSDVIGFHFESPFVSEEMVDFNKNTVYRGSVMPVLIRAHASLMAVAWLGFAGLAIVLARYYKDGFDDKTWCGVKIWFHLHRLSAFMTFALTVSGIILVLIKLDGKLTEDETAFNHMCLGFTVVALVCVQVLSGLLRPGLDSKYRPFFAFFHRLLGTAALIIAAAAIIYAYKMSKFVYQMRQFGERTVAVWAGIFLFLEIWHFGYKTLCYKALLKRQHSGEFNLDKVITLEPDEFRPPSKIMFAIFIFFICCSIVAALCMTIFF